MGIYMEHYTRFCVFEDFIITGTRRGIFGEWNDPATGGIAGAHNTTIRNGSIDSVGSTLTGNQSGVYLDFGTESTSVTGVTFKNQNWAAIGAPQNIGTNVWNPNTYQLPGKPFTTSHYSQAA